MLPSRPNGKPGTAKGLTTRFLDRPFDSDVQRPWGTYIHIVLDSPSFVLRNGWRSLTTKELM